MLTLGGYLKKKETISARLGDVLSAMYLASMVLKHHENRGQPAEELPVVEWACRELLYQAQEQLHGLLRNFPNRPLAALMRLLIFPRGLTYFAPADRLGRRVADLVLNDTATRARLSRLVYRTAEPGNPLGALQQALELAAVAEPLERKCASKGRRPVALTALDLPGQIEQARALGILSDAGGATADRLRPRASWRSSMSMISRPRSWRCRSAAEHFRARALQAIEGDRTCVS